MDRCCPLTYESFVLGAHYTRRRNISHQSIVHFDTRSVLRFLLLWVADFPKSKHSTIRITCSRATLSNAQPPGVSSGRYKFPVDNAASVCGFEAYINGKHVVGRVKEKEQARKEYKQAIDAGHGAYLLEEDKETPDVFTLNVGNIPPGAAVVVQVMEPSGYLMVSAVSVSCFSLCYVYV